MREKYESLSLTVLKELAKARGMKGISAMKKSDLVEAMLAQDERTRHMRRSSGRESRRAESARNTADRKEKAQKGRFRERKPGKRCIQKRKPRKRCIQKRKSGKQRIQKRKHGGRGAAYRQASDRAFPARQRHYGTGYSRGDGGWIRIHPERQLSAG